MAQSMFRKTAIERLSTPEQLDQLIQITTPKGWLALISLAGILVAIIVWSIFGSLPEKVYGQGILIKSGGVVRVVSMARGQLTDIRVDIGDIVKKGQVIARVAQPELIDKIKMARLDFKKKKEKYDKALEKGIKEEIKLKLSAIAKETADLKQSIHTAQGSVKWLEEKTVSREKLLKEGLVTKQSVISVKNELDATKERIKNCETRMKQLSAGEAELREFSKDELDRKKRDYENTKRYLETLRDKLELTAEIASAHTGRVIMIESSEGDLVAQGTPLLTLELFGKTIKDLEAVLYLSPAEGKKVKAGMNVNISPTTVKREEYGFIVGKATYVSEFPATAQSMMRTLNNEQLVRQLSMGSAPIEATVDLVPSADSITGYKWSSKQGPPHRIQSGTLCTAEFIVSRSRPIRKLIPFIKKKMGI